MQTVNSVIPVTNLLSHVILWPVYCVAGQLLVPESFHHSHHCMLPAPFVFSCPAESIGSPVRQIVS